MKRNSLTFVALTLAASVVLSGMHAKDLPALAVQAKQREEASNKRTANDDSNSPHGRISGEVHNHIEKQTLKSALKVFGDHNMQVDARHLKRQRHRGRVAAEPRRLRGVLALISQRTAALLSASV